jgi:hypothetical protein
MLRRECRADAGLPSAPGGIHMRPHRLVRHAERLHTRVVTLAASDADGCRSAARLDVRCVR